MSLFSVLFAALFSLSFNDGTVSGADGNAMLFDGLSSRIVVPASEVPEPSGSFTLDVWICPVAFPKSPCPVMCRQSNDVPGGWSLWLDARGRAHFSVASAGEWVSADSGVFLDLDQWSRLTCMFKAGDGLYLAVNGSQVAYTPLELPSVPAEDYPLWVGRTPVRTPSYYENKNIPIYSSFDGAIDELSIFGGTDEYSRITGSEFVRPVAPAFEPRILPAGPEGLAFGSWYIPLKFYDSWDAQWRGSLPDIVVSFGEANPTKVVFWKGISYAPCFVTEKGNWMCNEFIERSKVTGWGCPESMSDKHADFSSIRIVENTPARTVVMWRNAPVGVNQKFPYQEEETQWGDWSEETYIFYPDGTGVRRMDVWSSNLDDWSEWCQSLQVLHPRQRPEDVLDSLKIMSVAAMDGRSATFGWKFDTDAIQHEPSIDGANIQVTYLRSGWNPFLILDDRDGLNDHGNNGPEIYRYAGHWSEYSAFPWRNHWPVAQDYVIGRYAAVADAPSHTYTATQYSAPYYKDDRKMTKLMLCGCTDKDADRLLPLAKSWLRAPELTCGGSTVEYDLAQRAYIMNAPGGPVNMELAASKEHPASGMCLLIKGWKGSEPAVLIDGRKAGRNDVRIGHNVTYEGETLVLWLYLHSEKKIKISVR